MQGIREKEYMAKHKFILLQMLQAKYRNIWNDDTSARISLNFATIQPHYTDFSLFFVFH